ncbi:MAG: SPFH domain-containing protein [Eubacteriales bacterium]|nr:SPFH domain-containing protein [Eubacteriales bacterium]
MGLIRSTLVAANTTLGDQWKEYFYCDSLDADTLMVKGKKRTSKRSSNKHGSDNIISNGSVISVNNGQCMIIVEQGKIVEFCAEAGEFVWNNSTEPSVFTGGFGKGIIESFKIFGRRFTFGGDTGKDQRVYYFNTKEIVGNKYGTATPVPFRVVDNNIGLDVDISIRCNGEYSYKIEDPILFYTNVCGNVQDSYTRDSLDGMLRTELLTALQPAFAKISAMGVRYSALPGHTNEIADALNEVLSEKWRKIRGIAVASFGINSVSASEEDEKMIKDLQRTAVMRNPGMAGATLVGAQADAMKAAAANSNGAMMGFMGLNMANAVGGNNVQTLFNIDAQNKANTATQTGNTPSENEWKCSCGEMNTGKFCQNCGAKKPEAGWVCSCGTVNKGKFCQNCGAKKPSGEPLYRCDKCGWEPEDPKHPPKFCPECGDPFNDNDIK